MRKNYIGSIGLAALMLILAGCFASTENLVAPGVDNRTQVAYGSSTVSNPDFPREFFVKAAPRFAGKADCETALIYTGNGLAALGMTRLEAEKPDALTVVIDFVPSAQKERTRYEFSMRGMMAGSEVWRVRTYCFGEFDQASNYLPGLVAGALPLVGANRPAAAINLKNYQSYLEAVISAPPVAEAAEKPVENGAQ